MMSFAVVTIVKATLVCGAALILSRVCRRTRASIRHLLFVLAFTALIAIPAASTVFPTVTVRVPQTATVRATRMGDVAPAIPPWAAETRSGSIRQSIGGATATTAQSVTAERGITIVWLAGIALCLVPALVGFWQLRRLRRGASPWIVGQARLQTLAAALGLRRPIVALLHESVAGPMTCGALRPAIILPSSAGEWTEATLARVLNHELEHAARWDFLTQCLCRIVCAVYWFHPLVWTAWRRLRLEAERACDDAVLRESDAKDYASLLVDMARRASAATRQPLIAMTGHGDLTARVAAVLDPHQSRGRVGRVRSAAVFLAGVAVAIGLSAITIAGAVPQTQPGGNDVRASFETALLKPNEGVGTPSMYFSGDPEGKPGTGPDGRVQFATAINVTARALLRFAYGSELGERANGIKINNAPAWVDSDRFDIVAKAPFRATVQQMQQMLQSLLTDRFRLKTYRGSTELPIYAIVLSRPGRPGPALTLSQLDCRSNPRTISSCGLSSSTGRLAGRGLTMVAFVKPLAEHLRAGNRIMIDRPLVDRTGLTGAFDFTLEWTPDPVVDAPAPEQAGARLPGGMSYVRVENATNFLTAMELQLGLELVPDLVVQPSLIIDEIERPTGN